MFSQRHRKAADGLREEIRQAEIDHAGGTLVVKIECGLDAEGLVLLLDVQ